MRELAQQRLVSVTGTGAALPGEQITTDHAVKRAHMTAVAEHLLRDGEAHLAQISATSLDWTVLRVPAMTAQHDWQPRPYTLVPDAPHPTTTVQYASAAHALVNLATTTGEWSRRAPFITTNTSSDQRVARRPS